MEQLPEPLTTELEPPEVLSATASATRIPHHDLLFELDIYPLIAADFRPPRKVDTLGMELYRGLVSAFRQRRVELGLSQFDVNDAMGTADGYLSKLEAVHRTASFSTLMDWGETLGLSMTMRPTKLPKATLEAIRKQKEPARNDKEAP